MKMQVILLNKNFYEMDNGRGANVLIYGDLMETNNKKGVSISEASIPFEEHKLITVFPARYEVDVNFSEVTARNGKSKTSMSFRNLKLLNEVEFHDKK